MNHATYYITGGDYEGGGAASKQLKEVLKKVGVDPKVIRRTMIAAYEAEMNVVIHARRGVMSVAVDHEQVDVAVEDEGPGIPDIEQAMREGFSTAPVKARELGFGAGMGLPNIRENCDRFAVRSVGGKGAEIRFSIFLKPLARGHEASAGATNSIRIVSEQCNQCLMCLHACPTGAIRVRNGSPRLLDHLCVDCTACIQVCDTGALHMGRDEIPAHDDETVLVLPGALLDQFGAAVEPEDVFDACRELGFKTTRLLDEWEQGLRKAVSDYARQKAKTLPVLSPVCPAVVNLIQLRFPSLLGQVAPFLSPFEAAREELNVPHVVFAVACPAQRTSLRLPGLLTKIDVIAPSVLCGVLLQRLHAAPNKPAGKTRKPTPASPVHDGAAARARDVLQVSGKRHVMKVLDALENGRVPDCPVLELFICDHGCFGSPVWTESAFVAAKHHERAFPAPVLRTTDIRADGTADSPAGAVNRTMPLKPRAGLRLDPDMREAIRKLARIDVLTKALPGRNCGFCGAPACAALAEDVVLGEADIRACVYRDKIPTEEGA